MAFSRKYEIESEKNYDEFMKYLGEWGPEFTFPGLVCNSQLWARNPNSWSKARQDPIYSFIHSPFVEQLLCLKLSG